MVDFDKLKAVNPEETDINSLVDISTIEIERSKTQEERVNQFLAQIKNPYLCRYGELIVTSVFSETDTTLDEKMKQYFRILNTKPEL